MSAVARVCLTCLTIGRRKETSLLAQLNQFRERRRASIRQWTKPDGSFSFPPVEMNYLSVVVPDLDQIWLAVPISFCWLFWISVMGFWKLCRSPLASMWQHSVCSLLFLNAFLTPFTSIWLSLSLSLFDFFQICSFLLSNLLLETIPKPFTNIGLQWICQNLKANTVNSATWYPAT